MPFSIQTVVTQLKYAAACALLSVLAIGCGGPAEDEAPATAQPVSVEDQVPEGVKISISSDKAVEVARAEAETKKFDDKGFDIVSKLEGDNWVVNFTAINPDESTVEFEVTIDRYTGKVVESLFKR